MKLTDDLPKWIALPLRLVLYAFVVLILFNVALSVVKWRVMGNTEECISLTSKEKGALNHAKSMVRCLKQKNGVFENLLMGSVYRAIDAMPSAPKDFVGTWEAAQPRCKYRHQLQENGMFTSEPMDCSLSADTFKGEWGVYDNHFIWLSDEGVVWPPDINPMDVVDKDFFLLVERDGTRTKFSRVVETAPASPAQPTVNSTEEASVTPLATHATSPDQPLRWVLADDVRVRIGPDSEKKVIGTLPRGAELILKSKTSVDDYCLIEGEGHYGYVACQYLSAEPVARRRAGEEGVDVMQRWVSGNGVTVREAPRPDSAVVGRVALNAVVKLIRLEATGGYCEVQLLSGQNGFTACRYLATTPVIISHIRGYRRADETPSPDYDPERAFWLEPSWYALEAYAEYLKHLQPGIPPEGPWPRNDVLERMKAHLALGLKGRKPEPYPDWAGLKRKASLDMELSGESRHLQAQGGKVSDEVWRREWQHAIGIWGTLHDSVPIEGAARIIRLVRALEFADVRPSLFRNEAELAPPRVTAEGASGRFSIVYRQVVTPRPKPASGSETGSGAGLYDMLARTQLLVRPIKRIQLFRDGRLVTESSLLRMKETLWRDVDEPMCSGWIPGFSFGSADARIWRYFGQDAAVSAKSNRNPAGSLYAFYTNIDPPRGAVLRTETQVKLDRDATGFVRGTHLYYDLDGDGTPDIAVWEGEGKGPGHLEGSTITDDRWYRLVLVNVAGAWKVLGSDVFEYGCGC